MEPIRYDSGLCAVSELGGRITATFDVGCGCCSGYGDVSVEQLIVCVDKEIAALQRLKEVAALRCAT
jgi:hypothetical protein